MVVAMVKQDTSAHDLSSVRMAMTGAAPLTEEVGRVPDTEKIALTHHSGSQTANALRKKFPKWTFGQGTQDGSD